MVDSFREGFEFFQKNSSAIFGSQSGAYYGQDRAFYFESVQSEINLLEEAINNYKGSNTAVSQLKGNVAEHWHSGTFNIDAARNRSLNRTTVDISQNFGSVDISSNFEKTFGLKTYRSGAASAKAQSVSIFEKFKDYQAKGGRDSLDKYLKDRNYSNPDAVLNDPLYMGQIRLIPKGQLEEAIAWLERRIDKESVYRPEQVKRYQETLSLLTDRIRDGEGSESIAITDKEAEKLARLAREGKFDAEEHGIKAPEILEFEEALMHSLKAGVNAALISMVLKMGPEIYKAIAYLIKEGEIKEDQFKVLGFAALTSSAEGFLKGSITSAFAMSASSGILGQGPKDLSPSALGTLTVLTMTVIEDSYGIIKRERTRTELANNLIKNMIIMSISRAVGQTTQIALPQLPVISYMLGSFVGSVVGSFTYDMAHKTTLALCVETGITLFGLVDQDYRLPDDLIADMGIATFDYESFERDTFEVKSFSFDSFEYETMKLESLGISFLRRGVIGVSKVGYVA